MSDHFDNGRFFNPNGADAQPFWKAPRMLFERYAPWPAQVPVVQRPSPPPTSSDEITPWPPLNGNCTLVPPTEPTRNGL